MIDKTIVNVARALIGSRLRDLRKKKGLTQPQVSELIGVSVNTICKVENGKFDFGVDILNKLAHVYEVEVKIEQKA